MSDVRLLKEVEDMEHWEPHTMSIPESLILHRHKKSPSPLSVFCSINGNSDITGRQIVVFLLMQLGTLVETPVIVNNDENGKHCFLKCENNNDFNKLVKSLSCCDRC